MHAPHLRVTHWDPPLARWHGETGARQWVRQAEELSEHQRPAVLQAPPPLPTLSSLDATYQQMPSNPYAHEPL